MGQRVEVTRAYDELPFAEATKQAVRVLGDGYGDLVVIQDEAGYWALYYFYWAQDPPPGALPHWVEGPLPTLDAARPPFAMKTWLSEMGYEEYMNDVD